MLLYSFTHPDNDSVLEMARSTTEVFPEFVQAATAMERYLKVNKPLPTSLEEKTWLIEVLKVALATMVSNI